MVLSIMVFFLVNAVLFAPCSMAMSMQVGSHDCCKMPNCTSAQCFSGSVKGLLSASKHLSDGRTLKDFSTNLKSVNPASVKTQDESPSSHFLRSFFPHSPPVDLFIQFRSLLI